MQLAFDDHRIDQGAEIIDAGIFDEFDKASLRIDLDFGDVAAVRVSRRARSIADVHHIERLRNVGGRLEPAVQFLRELHDRDGPIGADNDKAPAFKGDIRGPGFEHMRRELLAAFDDLCRALNNRGAAMHQRLRAAGAAANRLDLVAIALDEFHFLDRNAELVTEHLREWRGVAHAEIERAGGERNRKSTRLNSSHVEISYAVFCLKKKKKTN